MTLDIALTPTEIAALDGPSQVFRWLVFDTDASVNIVATAQINQIEFSYPLSQLTVDNTSGWSAIVPGMIIYVGATPGAFDKGIFAVRTAGTSTTLELTPVGEGDSGELTIAIRTAAFEDNNYITILNRNDIFGLNPRIDYPGTGDLATIYENYDNAYNDQNRYSVPIVNLIIDGTPGNFGKHVYTALSYTFDIEIQIRLWATSSSAAYTITLPSGITLNSGSLTGTEAGGTINVTALASADPYTIEIETAENNGQTLLSKRKIWIKNNIFPPIPVAKVDSDSYARDSARMSLTLNNQELKDAPPGTMYHYFEDAKWNDTTVESAVNCFSGYVIRRRNVTKEGLTQTSIELGGPCAIMQLIGANSQRFEASDDPQTWQEVIISLSYLDFIIFYFFRTRAFGLIQMFNYTPLNITNSTAQMTDWRIEAGTLYSQVQSLAQRYRESNVGSDPSGEIFVRSHVSVIDYDFRDTYVTTRCTLHENIYQSVDFAKEERPRVRRLRGEAFVSDAVNITPVWCDAPGSVPGQGASEEKLERQVADSASDIYQITGDSYARRNNPYPTITITIKKNYNVIKPTQMYRILLRVPAWLHPDNVEWSGYVLPISVNRRHNEDGTVDTIIVCEAETAGIPAIDVPVPLPDDTTYSPFSRVRFTRTPSGGWGKASTNVPLSGNGLGGLWATSDGYVLRGGVTNPTNISPTAAQRNAIGTAIKMIADPYNYRRLILYGSLGAVVCDDHTAVSPKWRTVSLTPSNISNTVAGTTISLTYPAFTSATCTGPATVESGNIITVQSGSPNPNYEGAPIYVANVITSICCNLELIDDPGWTLFDQQPTVDGPFATIDCDGNTRDYPPTVADGRTTLPVGETFPRRTRMETNSRTSYQLLIRVTAVPTGTVYISDIQGSINRQGYFCWLTKTTVGGIDYVYFNYTADSFRTRKTKQVAKWQSDLYYTIQLRSYNSNTSGVVFVTAGTTTDSTAKVYKSTNWGGTFSATSTTLTTRGGVLNVPYNKSGGSANSSTSPQYGVVKGLSGGNLQFFALNATTNTVVATSSYPIHPYALGSYTLNGAILSLILQDRTFYTSSNGGVSWTAKATPTGGTSATAVGCCGSPVNSSFYFSFGYRLLSYSSNGGASWNSIYSAWETWRSANLGGSNGENIISAFMDLSKLYAKSVTT